MSASFTAAHNEMNRCPSQTRKAGKRQSSASRFSPYGAKASSPIPPPGLCENPLLSHAATKEIAKAQEARKKAIQIELLLSILKAGIDIKQSLLELLSIRPIPERNIGEYIDGVQEFLMSHKTHKTLANRLLSRFEDIERGEPDYTGMFDNSKKSHSTSGAELAAKEILGKNEAERKELIKGFVTRRRLQRCLWRKEEEAQEELKRRRVRMGAQARPDGPDVDDCISMEFDEAYDYEESDDDEEYFD